MFGFSLTKLVFTILIVVVVWMLFKKLSQAGLDQKGKVSKARGPAGAGMTESHNEEAEDLVKCSVCGAYMAEGSPPSCSRTTGCPFASL